MNRVLFVLFSLMNCCISGSSEPASTTQHPLLGSWQLDMTPDDLTDQQFAWMRIASVTGDRFSGEFYRPGVTIRHGQLNQQGDRLYGALTSADNSGSYHTQFSLSDGVLTGTTHALDRGFLAVWKAHRIHEPAIKSLSHHQVSFVEADSLYAVPEGVEYRFGYLTVPENREQSDSRMISVPVYVFKSPNPNAAKDPLISLTGGPGLSQMQNARWIKAWRYLEDRDLIFIDQRGTQHSRPALNCPQWPQAVQLVNQSDTSRSATESVSSHDDPRLLQALNDCHQSLVAQGIDLNGYHSEAIAADVEDLRRLLGIKQYNLYAVSYGAKVAQVLLRDHSSQLRSVVLDSPLPMAVNYDETGTRHVWNMVNQLLSDCASQTACERAYPKLIQRFATWLEQLAEQPILISDSSAGSAGLTRYLRGRDVALALASVDTATLSEVPWMLDQVIGGNQELLKAITEQGGQGSGFAWGMRMSVWCAEESPFVSTEVIEQERSGYPQFAGLSPVAIEPVWCAQWPVKARPATANQMVHSDVPVLIIHGAYDHLTPPHWGQGMLPGLANGHLLVFKGFHHTPTTYWDQPCPMLAAKAFLQQPDQMPELTCIEELADFAFQVR